MATPGSHTNLSRDNTKSKLCQDLLISVHTTSTRFLLDVNIDDNWDAVDYIFSSTHRDSFIAFQPIVGYVTVAAQYNIGATFCAPKIGGKNSETVLLLTHGSMQGREFISLQRWSFGPADSLHVLGIETLHSKHLTPTFPSICP